MSKLVEQVVVKQHLQHINSNDSKQIKLGQPSQNCMSGCLECHKALFLAP